mgnify:CR=1 FL=1
MVVDTRVFSKKETGDVNQASVAEAFDGTDQLLKEYSKCGNFQDVKAVLLKIRQSIPTKNGIKILHKIVIDPHDSRQLVVAQILGYHREWLNVSNGIRVHLDLIRKTKNDSSVTEALVWGLRQREEISEYLLHPSESVAREAALGVPLGRRTIFPILDRIRKSSSSEITRILLLKLRNLHPSLMQFVLAALVEDTWTEGAVIKLFSALPQTSVFDFFIDKEVVVGDLTFDIGKNSRWHSAVRIAKEVLISDPSSELIKVLLVRSGDDELFSRRQAAFTRSVMRSVGGESGRELMKDFKTLTLGASEEKVFRLAESLVELGSRLDGESAKKIQAMLEEWKSRSAALKLKIYQLEQRIV